MKRTFTKGSIVCAMLLGSILSAHSQAINEGFNDITQLVGAGWFMQNNSLPLGVTNWFQGTNVSAGGPFDSYAGAPNAYIGTNFNNCTTPGDISNWLLTPNRTFKNGDVITFYTRKVSPDDYADRLEVRMSTNGASTNVGTGPAAVGDFTNLLVSINPTLVLGVYPTVWMQYTITVSGLMAPTSGRIAFRYYVTNGGPTGVNSDYIGIDEFVYTPYVCPLLTISPNTLPNGTAGVAYNQSLSQTGALGAPAYAVTAGALPPGMTLATNGTISGTPTATGTFNFTVTVGDASGCTGSQAYSIVISCPANTTTVGPFQAVCNDAAPITLTTGNPAGGVYSGTGVTGGVFDPSVGTQTITYTVTDAYACVTTATASFPVNTVPTVTLGAFTPVCSYASPVALSGGSPAGGSYSGTGVTGGNFDPASGTQDIVYTYTDANGCSNADTSTFTVNPAPTVTLAPFSTPLCEGGAPLTLTGGSPAGGTYSGNGVSAGAFTPGTAGTYPITYVYTDGNNCSDTAAQDITVVDCSSGMAGNNGADLKCYPNPSTGIFNVELAQAPVGEITIRVMNVQGQVVMQEIFASTGGLVVKSMNISTLPKGLYILEVNNIRKEILLQ